ncbi:aminotransferase class III-fold pyridoxal phosphate-dependent enzyme [Aquirufa sp. 5-AUSEE-100C1]|jgi:glutamate-1-semialdehyde 2,1-aminomutase
MKNKVQFNAELPQIQESLSLYARGLQVQHPITQTLAKGPGQFSKGVSPIYLKKGKGARVWDVDGNEYIDFNMGIGPLSLGYCIPEIDSAIKEQLEDGITFSLMHPLEVEVAEKISQIIPNAEAVKFSKTGADVTSAAVRVARAFTGREKVFCCGYHGWHDWYIGITSRGKGIPESIKNLSYTFAFNDIESIKNALDETVACVILEPFIFEKPQEGFLQELAEICRQNGTLLIFDEMWSGFRISLGGAQEFFGVKADLATFSKACANGMPIAILTGRKDVMSLFDHDVFSYTTFGGEALSLAACQATIQFMEEHQVSSVLAAKGKFMQDSYNQLAKVLGMSDITSCVGYPCRTMLTYAAPGQDALELKTFMQQELLQKGILWGGFHNMCYSHSHEDMEYTLSAYAEILPRLKAAIESNSVKSQLKGEVLEAVFRKISDHNIKPKN